MSLFVEYDSKRTNMSAAIRRYHANDVWAPGHETKAQTKPDDPEPLVTCLLVRGVDSSGDSSQARELESNFGSRQQVSGVTCQKKAMSGGP